LNANHSNRLEIPLAENEVADRDIFDTLDPDWPGLEKVMHAYRSNKIEEAKQELITYFYERKSPKWFFDYRGKGLTPINLNENRFIWGDSRTTNEVFIKRKIEDADRLCRHQFLGAVLHDLGDHWDRFPIFDHTQGEDNKPLRVTANSFIRMNFLNSLAIAYHQTGDRRYGETFVQLMDSILDGLFNQYPFMPDPLESVENYTHYFSRNPFRTNMTIANSVLNVINLMHTELFYADFVPAKLSFRLFRYIWYVMHHHRSYNLNRYRHYNHHLFERGMMPLIIGMMFSEFPVFRPMLNRGKEVIGEHLKHDFNPTGGYDEHSFGYTCNTTFSEMFLPIKVLTDINNIEGINQALKERLGVSYSFYSSLVLPDGTFPDIGDFGGGQARFFLEQGIHLYQNKTAKAVLHALGLDEEHNMGTLAAEKDGEGSLPPITINDPLTGYLCSREDWTSSSNCMVLSNKVFSRNCSHNHLDMLSLILVIRGETLIGEPQAPILYKYVSNQSELDDYLRGLGSHNTVFIKGEPITKKYLGERLHAQTVNTEEFEEQTDRVYVKASHEAYVEARHTREVLFVRRQGWWIVDRIDWNQERDAGSSDYHIQRWHLEHGVQVEAAGTHAWLLTGKKARMLCVWPEDDLLSLHIWRNESVLEIGVVPEYKDVSDLPWILDVRFQSDSGGRIEQIQCIFVDVTDETANIQARVDRCRELFKGNRPLKEQVNL
jgi:hypothetical protein